VHEELFQRVADEVVVEEAPVDEGGDVPLVRLGGPFEVLDGGHCLGEGAVLGLEDVDLEVVREGVQEVRHALPQEHDGVQLLLPQTDRRPPVRVPPLGGEEAGVEGELLAHAVETRLDPQHHRQELEELVVEEHDGGRKEKGEGPLHLVVEGETLPGVEDLLAGGRRPLCRPVVVRPPGAPNGLGPGALRSRAVRRQRPLGRRLPSEGDAVEAFVVVGGGEEARRVPVLLQLERRLVPPNVDEEDVGGQLEEGGEEVAAAAEEVVPQRPQVLPLFFLSET